jgi:hypothetical protein
MNWIRKNADVQSVAGSFNPARRFANACRSVLDKAPDLWPQSAEWHRALEGSAADGFASSASFTIRVLWLQATRATYAR